MIPCLLLYIYLLGVFLRTAVEYHLNRSNILRGRTCRLLLYKLKDKLCRRYSVGRFYALVRQYLLKAVQCRLRKPPEPSVDADRSGFAIARCRLIYARLFYYIISFAYILLSVYGFFTPITIL